MLFDGAAADYDRFMGRYSRLLAGPFADFAGVSEGQRALDVGCGPGALTSELVGRLGGPAVAAVDPSEPYVAAARSLHPDADIRVASAEDLPFPDGGVDVTLAQLVVHFLRDPGSGLRELARVTRPGGTVAACVWDHHGGSGPLALFWEAVHQLDPGAAGEAELPGTREGQLEKLLEGAELSGVVGGALTVEVRHPDVDDWWRPYELGVGPAGAYVRGLDEAGRTRLRDRCAELLPPAPFTITARAWAARGSVR